MIATSSLASPSPNDLHAAFLALVPTIKKRARIAFAYYKCANQKAEKVAEAVALAWKWFVRLHERGKDAATFPGVFAILVARAVASGRRLAGGEPLTDVMSRSAQRKHGFTIKGFSSDDSARSQERSSDPITQKTFDALEERLVDNRMTPIPDQAAFRIDFPQWLKTLPFRERSMVQAMMRDERTNDLGKRFGVSPGRISQVRSKLRDEWETFCGEEAA